MPTIAIVGAGPGLGHSIAKVFGAKGFSVALVARDPGKLDDLAAQLHERGVDLQPQVDYYVHGAVTATREVLPDMLERGAGTLLYTTGASSVHPAPMMGNVGPAAAALRNWVLSLHQALDGTGVHAAHVPLDVRMGSRGPETQPDTIAQLYWDLYLQRDGAEHLYTP